MLKFTEGGAGLQAADPGAAGRASVPGAAEAADAGQAAPTIVDLIEAGAVDLVINTPRGRGARADGYEIRRVALRRGCLATMTTIAAAQAAVQAIEVVREGEPAVICLQELHQSP